MTIEDSPPGVHPYKLRQAVRTVRLGGVIAYPTEAVYGLGCDPLNPAAVYRLLAMKNRPVEKGLILIAADFLQLQAFILPLGSKEMKPVHASWPGPNTWLLPANPAVPSWLTGEHTTLAVRVTAHPLAAALCRTLGGPLVSTSANLSMRHPARTSLQTRLRCDDGIDMILQGTTGAGARPTTIRDARTGETLRP